MDEETNICQTCLSNGRLLYPLSRFTLLMNEIHLELKTKGGICWECKAIMVKFFNFKTQVQLAQEELSNVNKHQDLKTLSTLTISEKDVYSSPHCNLDIVIKQELIDREYGDITEEITEVEERAEVREEEGVVVGEKETDSGPVAPPVAAAPSSELWSELPRITLVKSIKGQDRKATNQETNQPTVQPLTQETEPIIELNIPLPQPSVVQEVKDSQREKTKEISEENVGETTKSDVVNVPEKDIEHEVQITRIKEEILDVSHDDVPEESPAVNDKVQLKTELQEHVFLHPGNVEQNYITWKKSVMLVYNRLRLHRYASYFQHRITDAMAPKYSRVVRHPMDFNTIRKGIKTGVIRTTAHFQRDLLLMLSNALMYNSSDYAIYDMAKDLLEEVKYQIGVLLTVHANTSLPETSTPRRRRGLQPETALPPNMEPPRKVPRLNPPPIKPKEEPLTPKVESKKRRRKFKGYTPKKYRKSIMDFIEATSREVKQELIDQTNAKAKGKKKNEAKAVVKVEKHSEDVTPLRKSTRVRKKKVDDIYATETPKKCKGAKPKLEPQPECSKIAEKTTNMTLNLNQQPLLIIPKLEYQCTPKGIKVEKIDKVFKAKESATENCSNDLCVAVTTKTQVVLTNEQANLIKKSLEEAILNITLNWTKFTPCFRGKPIIAEGMVKLWCENKKSLKWLKQTVKELHIKNIDELVVRKQEELRKLTCALSIPGSNTNFEVIKSLLKGQNPWAHIDSWALYSSEQRGENVFLVFGIPCAIIPKLVAKGRRLAYSLGSVYVRFYTNGELSDEPPSSIMV